ncbi:MAG: uroporphyrinogen-III C-methyltransferase, partial [Candidatus Omnitrophica bacterium]|nr:uroporphyrinogen-III C-methyltransferase [Candidatus Omnitrophota bacterium]
MVNKVYLVGAGPGKADLITVRGLNILKQADVVIYDYLVDKRILEEARQDAELICCDTLDKERYANGFLVHNEKINQLVIKKVKEGKKVVRLKNGDPAIFSRLSQELESLAKNKIEFEIVPGVTASSAASAFSGIPLTERRFASSCIFVTGHEDPTKEESLLDWESIAKQGTIVLYMAVENLRKIIRKLIAIGKSPFTPVAVIQEASLITQKMVKGNLKNIIRKVEEVGIRPPAVIIIGEVVKLEKNFNWLKKSKRILFTGLSLERFFLKGTYFHLPLIKIEPLDDYGEFDHYLKEIKNFDWIVFTSRYGVEYFFKRLRRVNLDSRILKGIKIAAIGNSTKNRLLDFGIIADLVPKRESSEGLVREFKNI